MTNQELRVKCIELAGLVCVSAGDLVPTAEKIERFVTGGVDLKVNKEEPEPAGPGPDRANAQRSPADLAAAQKAFEAAKAQRGGESEVRVFFIGPQSAAEDAHLERLFAAIIGCTT